MADLDLQRLQQQVDDLTASNQRLTSGTNQNLTAQQRSAAKTDAMARAAGGATSALGQLISQIYGGVQGAQVATKSLKSGVGAISGASRSFENSIGRNSKLARGLQGFGIGIAEITDVVAGMSDRLFESFQSLSRVGAAGADGMAGVFDQLQNFRLGLQDLGQLTQLFGQNAQSLVLFGGTVQQGAKSLGALRKFVTGSGLEQEFMALGMNTQEINESMAGFVALQSRLGMTQITNTAQITASLNAYILEQDKITKLTGATRKQQEDNTMRAMATEQFRAKLERLEAENTVASLAERDRLLGLQRMFYANNQQLGDAFTATASGFITKGPGLAGQLVLQGKLSEIVNNRQIDQAQAARMSSDALKQFNSGVGNAIASVGGFEEKFGMSFSGMIDASAGLDRIARNISTVEEEQLRQKEKPEAGVKAQIDLRTAQMDTMKNFQALVNIGVVPATQALAAFAQQAAKASRMLPGGDEVGGGPIDSSVGAGAAAGARSTDVVPGSGNAATGDPVIDALSGVSGNQGGLGIQQRIIGGALGAASSLLRQLGVGGGQEINADDVINFGSGSGSRQHFDQLQPQVRERALAMAQAYQKATKQKLNLNSAFRSAEEQAALAASGGQGANPIAEPGQSLHQQGRALDFNPTEVDYLEKMGLLKQFGFNRLQGDPPHIFMQDGGIATGPKSGYNAMLHGTEAVVPLPDGKTIPVTMPGIESSIASSTGQGAELQEEMSRQSGLIMNQISRLDELVALMRNANGISHKILQASTN